MVLSAILTIPWCDIGHRICEFAARRFSIHVFVVNRNRLKRRTAI